MTKQKTTLGPVNPCYSGGKYLEDRGSKPAQANSSRDPISKKNSSQKRDGGVAQVVPA
jgi:hypothetical protein